MKTFLIYSGTLLLNSTWILSFQYLIYTKNLTNYERVEKEGEFIVIVDFGWVFNGLICCICCKSWLIKPHWHCSVGMASFCLAKSMFSLMKQTTNSWKNHVSWWSLSIILLMIVCLYVLDYNIRGRSLVKSDHSCFNYNLHFHNHVISDAFPRHFLSV